MEACVFPIELIETIAMMRRDVFIALSSTCKRARKALSWSQCVNERRFQRRYVNIFHETIFIIDRWWLSGENIGASKTCWVYDKLIEILYPDNTSMVIQYKWNEGVECDGSMRKIIKLGPWPELMNPRHYEVRYEAIGCNTFENVVNGFADHDDLRIYDC